MNAVISQFVRVYVSDSAYTAAVLLAFGLIGATTGLYCAV